MFFDIIGGLYRQPRAASQGRARAEAMTTRTHVSEWGGRKSSTQAERSAARPEHLSGRFEVTPALLRGQGRGSRIIRVSREPSESLDTEQMCSILCLHLKAFCKAALSEARRAKAARPEAPTCSNANGSPRTTGNPVSLGVSVTTEYRISHFLGRHNCVSLFAFMPSLRNKKASLSGGGGGDGANMEVACQLTKIVYH